MTRVLFVCLGNICRSPLAEGIFFELIKNQGLDNQITVDSCGTGNYHIGELSDPRTMANARDNGITLNHHARQFSVCDFENFDYIVVMDRSNFQHINDLDKKGDHHEKIILLREYDPIDPGADVPDPYFGGADGFQYVFEIIERSIRTFLNKIVAEQDLTKP